MLGCGLPVCAVGLDSLSNLRGPAHSLLAYPPPLSLPGSTASLSSSSTGPTGARDGAERELRLFRDSLRGRRLPRPQVCRAAPFIGRPLLRRLIFRDARQLASQLLRLLAPTKEAAAALAALRAGVAASEAKRPRWAENWNEVAAPVLLPRGAGPHAATRRLMRLGTLALLVALFGACLLRGLVWMERRGWLDFSFDESEVLVPNWVEWLL